jgi:hypothetical protein
MANTVWYKELTERAEFNNYLQIWDTSPIYKYGPFPFINFNAYLLTLVNRPLFLVKFSPQTSQQCFK